jgi:hypothetical protein
MPEKKTKPPQASGTENAYPNRKKEPTKNANATRKTKTFMASAYRRDGGSGT